MVYIFVLSNINRIKNSNIKIPNSAWKNKNKVSLLRKTEKYNTDKSNTFDNYVFSPNNRQQSTPIMFFDEDALKDSVGHYNIHRYKTRFTLDYAKMYMSFDSYYGTTGMGIFLFSDILGDHRIGLATELQIDFEESDYFFFLSDVVTLLTPDLTLDPSWVKKIGNKLILMNKLLNLTLG